MTSRKTVQNIQSGLVHDVYLHSLLCNGNAKVSRWNFTETTPPVTCQNCKRILASLTPSPSAPKGDPDAKK